MENFNNNNSEIATLIRTSDLTDTQMEVVTNFLKSFKETIMRNEKNGWKFELSEKDGVLKFTRSRDGVKQIFWKEEVA